MKIKINNREEFITKTLTPLNKLCESAVLRITSTKLSSLISSNDNTIILSSTYSQENNVEHPISLNIPDLSRLIKVLNCIDESSIELSLKENSIDYNSNNVNFKYHLLEDGIISTPALDLDKIKKLDFDFSFRLTYHETLSLLKGSTFTTDTNKIYFYTSDDGVYGELTDKQKQNVDVFSCKICDEFKGALTNTPALSFEIIRMISSTRFEHVNVFLNTENNVFLFDISNNNHKLNYIVSGYVG